MGDCQLCVYRAQFEKDIGEIKDRCLDLERRMTEAEKNSIEYKGQIKSIFVSLERIEKSVTKISDKIDENESKPGKIMWGVLGTVLGALILAGMKFMN